MIMIFIFILNLFNELSQVILNY